ncbi:MAG: restriction endonuclease [Nitrospinota bacterium]|nr:restriction endonuclease [Nitrospinota bacterium]
MELIFHEAISNWRDLQNKACQILFECGMDAKTEVLIDLVRGKANIDVVANDNRQAPPTRIFIECKHWTTSVSQEKAHAFRTIVQDAGANIGFIISSSSFQSGAYKAVEATNIKLMTWSEFQNHFYARWFKEMKVKVGKLVDPVNKYSDYLGPITKGLNGTAERSRRAYKLWSKYHFFMSASPYLNMEVNGKTFSQIEFPMTCVDPRGDVDQQNKITIETAREYFDLIIAEYNNALKTYENFIAELDPPKE